MPTDLCMPPLPLQLASDAATHAASALRRTARFLSDDVFEEMCSDMLDTVGLRAAVWQHVVTMLILRGGPRVRLPSFKGDCMQGIVALLGLVVGGGAVE
jgi:hypothetical protein